MGKPGTEDRSRSERRKRSKKKKKDLDNELSGFSRHRNLFSKLKRFEVKGRDFYPHYK